MTEPVTHQVDRILGWGDSERWDRLYQKGMAIARLKGFTVHTKGCRFSAQSYEDRVLYGTEPCTCGLFAIAREALEEAERTEP